MIKKTIKTVFPKLWELKRKRLHKTKYRKWKQENSPIPPPHLFKQKVIAEYQEKSGYNIFLETGTFLGDMVDAHKNRFKSIISIELGADLFSYSYKRFRNYSHIKIIHGDSGKILHHVLKDFIHEPTIFWLDGHYSGGITAQGEVKCPIMSELKAIFNSGQLHHIILIDDARCFKGTDDYPSISSIIQFIKTHNSNYKIEIEQDIVRCTFE